ncbi:MAG TPA: hypothetical protein VGK74_14955 [Symbiobacteriaceae bacterium]
MGGFSENLLIASFPPRISAATMMAAASAVNAAGFAGAVDADVADHFARLNSEADPVHGDFLLVPGPEERLDRPGDTGLLLGGAKCLDQILDLNYGHAWTPNRDQLPRPEVERAGNALAFPARCVGG